MDKRLEELFVSTFGNIQFQIEKIAGAGSNRAYYRFLYEKGTVVGVVGTSVEENKAFINLARHFKMKGLNVPEVIAVDAECRCYLQEDLGTESLYDNLRSGRETGHFSEPEVDLMIKTVKHLADMQSDGVAGH